MPKLILSKTSKELCFVKGVYLMLSLHEQIKLPREHSCFGQREKREQWSNSLPVLPPMVRLSSFFSTDGESL
jgi:hypothetical protein